MQARAREIKGIGTACCYNAFIKAMIARLVVVNSQDIKDGKGSIITYENKRYGSWGEMLCTIREREEDKQIEAFKEAFIFVDFTPEELMYVVQYAEDENGVPYGKTNLANSTVEEIADAVACVFKACMEIKLFF